MAMMNAEQMFYELGYEKSTDIDAIAYSEKLEGTFYRFEITFDLLEKEIAIGTNMEYVIENDLLQAIIQQAKELGWLEEEKQEIKKESNFEHYKDEIVELFSNDLAISNGGVSKCNETLCRECGFADENCVCIRCYEIKKWFQQPYKKQTYKLSQFEYDLINTFDRCKECCLLNEIECLKKLIEKGYFKGIDPFTKVHDIIDNCEVIQ